MELSEDAKRQAVSAVAAVRDDIYRVVMTGSTGYDAFGQPRLGPENEVPEVPWVTQYRDQKEFDAKFQETLAKQRDTEAPGM
jgi:hypothetical protein